MGIGSQRKRQVILGSLGALALVLAAGCSSSEPEPTPTPTVEPTPTETGNSTVVFDEMIQQELADVGCYQGEIDGVMGPGTDAAIVSFQTAEGIEEDGELGPQTDDALKSAVDEGRTVCGGSASPSPTSSEAPCTATAIQAALPSGEKVTSFVCADGGDERWAAGDDSNKEFDAVFILKAEGGSWTQIDRDEVCGTASAGVPAKILEYCDVS